MTTRGGLRLIKFNPTDYSLASVLTKENTSILSDPGEIGAAFSLYFQWPEHRKALVKLSNDAPWQPCDLSCDEDERQPTELYVHVAEIGTPTETLIFRMEVFRTCYEFQANLLDSAKADGGGLSLITNTPESLAIFKYRRAPRLQVDDATEATLRTVVWKPEGSEAGVELPVKELGILSLTVTSGKPLDAGPGSVEIGGQSFKANISPRPPDQLVILLRFESGRDSGRYFDVYRKQAYPQLRWRYDLPEEQTLRLYQAYLDQHIPPEQHDEIRTQLAKTWAEIREGTHEATSDYVVLDRQGNVTGASSIALAFFRGDRQQWAIHQLCTLTDPNNFDLTLDLYTWRTDYLLSRPEKLDVVFWYVSKSRWLERIYTKFSTISNVPVVLEPVRTATLSLDRFSAFEDDRINPSQVSIGQSVRHFVETEDFAAAGGPNRLNIFNLLDNIVPKSFAVTEEQLMLCAQRASTCLRVVDANLSSRNKINLTIPWNTEISDSTLKYGPGDRYAEFSASALVDLRASIEHSVAVTKRKHEFKV